MTTKMWLVPVFIFVVTFVMLVLIDPNSQFQSVNHRARVIQMPIGASSH